MKKVVLLLVIFVTVLGITACNPFHTHTGNGEYIVVKEPTCTTEGESQMYCIECGEVAVTVPIPATGHKEVIIPAVEPTATENGSTEGKYCNTCNTVLIKPVVIEKNAKTTYTVSVVDTEGNPIAGVEVTFCPKGGTEMPWPTDAEGKATMKTSKEMTVKINEVPIGYKYNKLGQTLDFDTNGNLTVTLTVLTPFVINVIDQNGNAISGVKVQMCGADGSCRMPINTDVDGIATYPYEYGYFYAQLTTLPDGYSVEDIDAYYDFVDGVATIVLYHETLE